MENETIIKLTADIVSAHVSKNRVGSADMPKLIQSVFDALAAAGQPAPAAEEKPNPAVSIRTSVKQDAITCLECGQKLKMLKRHLGTDHAMTPAQYKARWDLPADYPMVAPAYAAKRKELALKIGLGRTPGAKGSPRGSKIAAAPPDTESAD